MYLNVSLAIARLYGLQAPRKGHCNLVGARLSSRTRAIPTAEFDIGGGW